MSNFDRPVPLRFHLDSRLHRAASGLRRLGIAPWVLSFGVALALSATTPIAAQPLSSIVCANGGPNINPFGMSEFLSTNNGTPMLRHTLKGDDSRCNDGTPAVMYIRPADAHYTGAMLPQGVIENEKWVILFLGGGGCGSPDGCANRWCGLSGYARAGKMSTAGAYDAIFGLSGIFKRNPALNQYAGYNQVVLYYCSSDNWIGSGSHMPATTGTGTTFDIEFNGEAIVNDAFDTLLNNNVVADAGPAATFYSTPLPRLDTADEIVLVGDSAGAGGLRHHLDRLRETLISRISEQLDVYAVLDAGFSPGLWQPGITFGAPGAPLSYADHLVNILGNQINFWGADLTAFDQSCQNPAFAAAHAADGGVDPEICYDTRYTQMNHITTPTFIRQDINDKLLAERYATWQLFPSAADFMAATEAQLMEVATLPPGHEAPFQAPGVFGPKCNRHVSLLSDNFFTHRIDPGGLSFHDLLVNWHFGFVPSTQIQADFNAGPAYTPSICP